MLVSFRSCGPKDHRALLKLVLAYKRFEKIRVNRKSLSQGLDVLLRNPSQGKMWLMECHKKPVGYALLTTTSNWNTAARRACCGTSSSKNPIAIRESARWPSMKSKTTAASAVCAPSSCKFHGATDRRRFFIARRDFASFHSE